MAHRRNEEIARRWYEEMWSTGDELIADELVHPDYDPDWVQLPTSGPAQIKQEMKYFRGIFPELKYEIVEMMAADDRVWVRYKGLGRQDKPAWGFEGSGKTAEFEEAAILYINPEGQVIDRWGAFCMYDIFHSLGLVPPWWELSDVLNSSKKE